MFEPTPNYPNFDFGQLFICQISDITSLQKKSDIWLKKIRYQISDPKKNQFSDITPPKKSNIRYLILSEIIQGL